MSRRRLLVWFRYCGLAIAMSWLVCNWWITYKLRRVERGLTHHDVEEARPHLDLIAHLAWIPWPWSHDRRVEINYLLGACQAEEGQVDAALATWARVAVSSLRGHEAALRRARLALDHGRLTIAEKCLEQIAPLFGTDAADQREIMLQELCLLEGRIDDLRRRKLNDFLYSLRPAEVLRKAWLIDESKVFPIQTVHDQLNQARIEAPTDDRVWLGQANLAIRLGHYQEAEQAIDECLCQRSDDPSVWEAQLNLAVATNHQEQAIEAARHIPANRLGPIQVEQYRGWLASQRGDAVTEEAAWQRILNLEPGNTRALVRLAELAKLTGHTERGALLLAHKVEIDRTVRAYRDVLSQGVPTGQFDKLAQHAETLGRWFEAMGWWTLSLGRRESMLQAREGLARVTPKLKSIDPSRIPSGLTLADLIAPLTRDVVKQNDAPGASNDKADPSSMTCPPG
jgi:enediyne biosynthesis protein E4